MAMRQGRKIAKAAMARRLALRLYWMWRGMVSVPQTELDPRGSQRPTRSLVDRLGRYRAVRPFRVSPSGHKGPPYPKFLRICNVKSDGQ